MQYNEMCGEKVSRLGYGMMRLPEIGEGDDKHIDMDTAQALVDQAMAAGINYYDTAYVYNNGENEIVTGKCLAKYPRNSYFVTDKYPGHMLTKRYEPAKTFETMLERLGVDYIDFFLLHNVFEKSMEVYKDETLGVIPYFIEQKRKGTIRHLGFSTHADMATLKEFLDAYGDEMEFCQMQLNYLDWTLQGGKEKYELLCERGIPVIVMEGLRGGMLAKPEITSGNEALNKDSAAGYGLRFIKDLENVKVVLSGMSSEEQLSQNIKTFSEAAPLSDEERTALFDVAEGMKKSVPCTGCRYCTTACPLGLDIPRFMSVANEMRVAKTFIASMQVEFLPEEKQPSACLSCGACADMCPQKIAIPDVIAELAYNIKNGPSWGRTVAEREAKALQSQKK